jgi:arsenical pump membrane protein
VTLAGGLVRPSVPVGHLATVLAFLVAVTVVAELADAAGVFDAAAHLAARLSGGRTFVLWAALMVLASASTIVLSLDTTAVLLTPVVLALCRQVNLPPLPFALTTAWLANTASLLLPVSNLTNLLAYRETGLSFTRFTALMVLPWAAMLAVEWLGLRRTFAGELAAPRGRAPADAPHLPRAPLAVLAATFAGFALSAPLGFDPAWAAAAGAGAMVAAERVGWTDVVRAIDLPLLGFVLGLAVIVRAVADHGASDLAADLLPSGDGVLALLGATAVAAILANLLNNLPAVLLLLPAAAAGGPAIALAVLIGVNAGPNLTPTGSLATLLWRRVLRAREAEPPLNEFLRLGALTVPPALVLGTVALWLAWQAIG